MDKTIFKKLLASHQNRIYSLAFYNLRNADDAADVTQDTFLRLWRFEGELGDCQAKAWLLRVCHNLCIDHSRRRKTITTYFGIPETEGIAQLECPSTEQTDPSLSIIRQECRQQILASLANLSCETRSIMVLHYFQDLRIPEIAQLLNLKPSTVKVRLHRARQTLKKHLNSNDFVPLPRQRETGSC